MMLMGLLWVGEVGVMVVFRMICCCCDVFVVIGMVVFCC